MSWKSLVSAGLLCVVASPLFAAPSLSVSSGGLDANGNWVWNVTITPTASGTPLAGELGFRETVSGSQLLTADRDPLIFDTINPGEPIFGWETLVDVDPGAGTNMKAEGIQTNCAAGCTVNASLDEVFSALGSIDLPAGSPVQYLTIKTTGPLSTNPTTSIQVLGKYGTGGTNGRIAEITGSAATNYSNFAGTATRTVVPGDANLSGVAGGGAAVTLADLTTLASSLNRNLGPRHWQHGDFNGTTGGAEVTLADLTILANCLNRTTAACSGSANTPLNVTGVAGGSGAALGGASAVPEPASVALAALALLGGLGLTQRRRQK